MADPTEVAQLLADSHSAHWLYQQHLPRMVAVGGGDVIPSTNWDRAAAKSYLQKASDKRSAADAADPEHSDPAWADEAQRFDHSALTTFYAAELAK